MLKRYFTSIALAVLMCFGVSLATPSMALASRYYGGYHHNYRHHRHHHDETSVGKVVAGILGIGAIAYLASRASTPSKSYEQKKAEYISKIVKDPKKAEIWDLIKDLKADTYYVKNLDSNNYKIIKEISQKLYKDYRIVSYNQNSNTLTLKRL